VTARPIRLDRVLHLDHLGAEVAQMRGRQRAREQGGDVDHHKSGQRTTVLIAHQISHASRKPI
jgi:hypothetical protein